MRSIKTVYFVALSAAIWLGVGVSLSHAIDPAPAPGSPQPSCNNLSGIAMQGCLFDRANETLMLQLHYKRNRLQSLQELFDQKNRNAEIIESLGPFCTEDEKDNWSDNDKVQACLDRHKRIETRQMRAIHTAIAKNDEKHSKLYSQKVYVDGSRPPTPNPAVGFNLPPPPGQDTKALRSPQVSYFASVAELEKSYEQNRDQMRASITNRFAQWLQDLPKQPSPEDFIKLKKIYRDPEQPGSGVLHVIDTEADGSAKIDKQAYEEALKNYANMRSKLLGDQKDLKDLESKIEQTLEPKLKQTRGGSLGDFIMARKGLVDQANAPIQGPAGGSRIADSRAPATEKKPASSRGAMNESVITTPRAETNIRSGADRAFAPPTGNEPVIVPPGTAQNQHHSYTITPDLEKWDNVINGYENPGVIPTD